MSLLLVIPSCLISQFAFVSSQYGKGGDKDNNSQKVPPSLLYIQGVVDSLLFLTQPLCLLITWFSIDTKAMKGHTSASSSQINRPHLVNVAVMDHNQQVNTSLFGLHCAYYTMYLPFTFLFKNVYMLASLTLMMFS